MKFYLVNGENPEVPGNPRRAFTDAAARDAYAAELVNLLVADANTWAKPETTPNPTDIADVPLCTDPADWQATLRAVQRRIVMAQGYTFAEAKEMESTDALAGEAYCNVWIEEYDVDVLVPEIALVLGEQEPALIVRNEAPMIVHIVDYDLADGIVGALEIDGDPCDLTTTGPEQRPTEPVVDGFWDAIDGAQGGAA